MSITPFLSLPLVLTSQLSQIPPNSNKAADLLPTDSAPLTVKPPLEFPPNPNLQRQLSIPISKPPVTEEETVTGNDSIGSGLSKLPNGNPVVNDYGDTFSFGKQFTEGEGEKPGTQRVTGYQLKANSDAYTPTSPSNPFSQRAGVNADSSSITVFTGTSNNATYNGINLTATGTNPAARDVQRSFHNGLNSLGFDTNPKPPLFNKGNGPTGVSIGLEKGICSRDLSPGNPINLNVCAQGELGLGYLNNSVTPYTNTSASIRLGLGNEDTKIKPTPLGLSSDKKGWQIYTQATGNCNINDPKGVLNPNGSTNSHCNVTASLGVQVPLGEQSQISLETKKNLTGTPSYNEHYNINGLPFELRVKSRF